MIDMLVIVPNNFQVVYGDRGSSLGGKYIDLWGTCALNATWTLGLPGSYSLGASCPLDKVVPCLFLFWENTNFLSQPVRLRSTLRPPGTKMKYRYWPDFFFQKAQGDSSVSLPSISGQENDVQRRYAASSAPPPAIAMSSSSFASGRMLSQCEYRCPDIENRLTL